MDQTPSREKIFETQNEIYQNIQLNEHRLILIKEQSGSLLEKWQALLEIILPIQKEAVTKNHPEGNEKDFNEEYIREALSSPSLCELIKKKWVFIFDKAFDLHEFKEISLQEAKDLISEIAAEMTSETFLIEVDHVIESLPENASFIQKRQAILTLLFPLHVSIMKKYGFNSDTGYIEAQRALMDYYHDPIVSKKAAHAQSVVFKRAGLIS